MPKVDAETLNIIEVKFEQFKREVRVSGLAPNTEGYLSYGIYYFIRWLKDDYTPGQGLRPKE